MGFAMLNPSYVYYNLLRINPAAVTCTVRVFAGKDFADAEPARFSLAAGRWVPH